MLGGYAGKILRVNLTKKTIVTEDLPEKLIRDYIGGAGFGIKFLLDETDPNAEALGPDNKLIFAVGPFTGVDVPCASRVMITAKSPLTGAVGMTTSGGYFPAEMKFAGFDIIIIEGKSEEPAFIWINEGKASIISAKEIWGTSTPDCQQMIKDKLKDQNIRIACIGQAGENLSLMASIINEKHAAGRKGLGAVMGSKNLKAIALRGTKPVHIADNDSFKKARMTMLEEMKASPVMFTAFPKFGTSMSVDSKSALGIFPLKNYAETGEHDLTPDIGLKTSLSRNISRETCYKCPVGCAQVKLAKKQPFTGMVGMPEYETYYSFGGTTMVDNIDAVIAADRICDDLGMDTISVGVAIGFAMELMEKGILTKADTDGIDLSFGNAEAMVEVVRKIGFREGIGDLLADGVKAAAQKIGGGAEKYAMHVKGLELPAYDVRGAKAHALNFATSYTGADHNRGFAVQELVSIPIPFPVEDRFSTVRKAELTKWNQDVRAACCDSAPMCCFVLDAAVAGICLENTANLLTSITGLDFSPEEVYTVGERCTNAARLFNLRAGFKQADDDLPVRLKTEAIKAGASKGAIVPREELEGMLDEYYQLRGWTKEGIPTQEKLHELGLD